MESNDGSLTITLRPGIVLVWLGLGLSILAIGCLPDKQGISSVSQFFFGVFYPFVAFFLFFAGMGFAFLAILFAVWGFIVTLVHRTGAYILASVALALSVLAGYLAVRPWLR
jgi:hypothetical protein